MENEEPNSSKEGSVADKSVWYVPGEKLRVSPYVQRLFEEYCGLPSDRVASHIIEVRERAWKVFPYPCIGNFRFLDFAITESLWWPEVVERLQSDGTFLDLGCCFAQDIRALAYAGVPSRNLFGADLKLDFIELGYELFRDKDSLQSTFSEGDIFDPKSFETLQKKMDIISARSFLHLFPPDEEFRAACRIVELLSESKGSIIMGKQVGSVNPGLHNFTLDQRQVFRHDPHTLKEFWDKVGGATSTQWNVEARLVELNPDQRAVMQNVELGDINDRAWLEFFITRL